MPLSLDGEAQTATANGSGSVTLSGSSSPDVVIVVTQCRGSGVVPKSVTDSYSLTYNLRFSGNTAGGSSIGNVQLNEYYAVSNAGTTLSGDKISVLLSGTGITSGLIIIAWGIAGANTSTIWDSSFTSVPVSNTLTSPGTSDVSTSGVAGAFTNNANDFVFGVVDRVNESGNVVSGNLIFNQAPTALFKQSGVGNAGDAWLAMQYNIVSATVSGSTEFTFTASGGTRPSIVFADAVIQASTSKFFQHSGPLRMKRFNR